MRTFKPTARLLAVALVAASGLSGAPAQAFDPSRADSSGAEATPELFALGFRAYQQGDMDTAVAELSRAAEHGHPGARWKLGEMYAVGEGVPENDYRAFRLYRSILRDRGRFVGRDYSDTAFAASAAVAVAGYLRTGIPGSPVAADLAKARQFYFHAASFFGDTEAQLELGRMTLRGEGGPAKPRQAARWLKLAADKGNVGARALLGSLLFDGERISMAAQPVRGLTMMITALKQADDEQRAWIEPMQADALAAASEADRKSAMANAKQQVAMAQPDTGGPQSEPASKSR